MRQRPLERFQDELLASRSRASGYVELASAGASYATGQILGASGGRGQP